MTLRTRGTIGSIIVVLSLLAARPRESSAQFAETAQIAAGTKVRVRTRAGEQRAWQFVRASPDSLTLRRHVHHGEMLRSIAWSDAERVDTVAIGPASGGRMLAGVAGGGLLGVIVAWLGAGLVCHPDFERCPRYVSPGSLQAIVVTGIFAGATAGYYERDRHWSAAWQAQ